MFVQRALVFTPHTHAQYTTHTYGPCDHLTKGREVGKAKGERRERGERGKRGERRERREEREERETLRVCVSAIENERFYSMLH